MEESAYVQRGSQIVLRHVASGSFMSPKRVFDAEHGIEYRLVETFAGTVPPIPSLDVPACMDSCVLSIQDIRDEESLLAGRQVVAQRDTLCYGMAVRFRHVETGDVLSLNTAGGGRVVYSMRVEFVEDSFPNQAEAALDTWFVVDAVAGLAKPGAPVRAGDNIQLRSARWHRLLFPTNACDLPVYARRPVSAVPSGRGESEDGRKLSEAQQSAEALGAPGHGFGRERARSRALASSRDALRAAVEAHGETVGGEGPVVLASAPEQARALLNEAAAGTAQDSGCASIEAMLSWQVVPYRGPESSDSNSDVSREAVVYGGAVICLQHVLSRGILHADHSSDRWYASHPSLRDAVAASRELTTLTSRGVYFHMSKKELLGGSSAIPASTQMWRVKFLDAEHAGRPLCWFEPFVLQHMGGQYLRARRPNHSSASSGAAGREGAVPLAPEPSAFAAAVRRERDRRQTLLGSSPGTHKQTRANRGAQASLLMMAARRAVEAADAAERSSRARSRSASNGGETAKDTGARQARLSDLAIDLCEDFWDEACLFFFAPPSHGLMGGRTGSSNALEAEARALALEPIGAGAFGVLVHASSGLAVLPGETMPGGDRDLRAVLTTGSATLSAPVSAPPAVGRPANARDNGARPGAGRRDQAPGSSPFSASHLCRICTVDANEQRAVRRVLYTTTAFAAHAARAVATAEACRRIAPRDRRAVVACLAELVRACSASELVDPLTRDGVPKRCVQRLLRDERVVDLAAALLLALHDGAGGPPRARGVRSIALLVLRLLRQFQRGYPKNKVYFFDRFAPFLRMYVGSGYDVPEVFAEHYRDNAACAAHLERDRLRFILEAVIHDGDELLLRTGSALEILCALTVAEGVPLGRNQGFVVDHLLSTHLEVMPRLRVVDGVIEARTRESAPWEPWHRLRMHRRVFARQALELMYCTSLGGHARGSAVVAEVVPLDVAVACLRADPADDWDARERVCELIRSAYVDSRGPPVPPDGAAFTTSDLAQLREPDACSPGGPLEELLDALCDALAQGSVTLSEGLTYDEHDPKGGMRGAALLLSSGSAPQAAQNKPGAGDSVAHVANAAVAARAWRRGAAEAASTRATSSSSGLSAANLATRDGLSAALRYVFGLCKLAKALLVRGMVRQPDTLGRLAASVMAAVGAHAAATGGGPGSSAAASPTPITEGFRMKLLSIAQWEARFEQADVQVGILVARVQFALAALAADIQRAQLRAALAGCVRRALDSASGALRRGADGAPNEAHGAPAIGHGAARGSRAQREREASGKAAFAFDSLGTASILLRTSTSVCPLVDSMAFDAMFDAVDARSALLDRAARVRIITRAVLVRQLDRARETIAPLRQAQYAAGGFVTPSSGRAAVADASAAAALRELTSVIRGAGSARTALQELLVLEGAHSTAAAVLLARGGHGGSDGRSARDDSAPEPNRGESDPEGRPGTFAAVQALKDSGALHLAENASKVYSTLSPTADVIDRASSQSAAAAAAAARSAALVALAVLAERCSRAQVGIFTAVRDVLGDILSQAVRDGVQSCLAAARMVEAVVLDNRDVALRFSSEHIEGIVGLIRSHGRHAVFVQCLRALVVCRGIPLPRNQSAVLDAMLVSPGDVLELFADENGVTRRASLLYGYRACCDATSNAGTRWPTCSLAEEHDVSTCLRNGTAGNPGTCSLRPGTEKGKAGGEKRAASLTDLDDVTRLAGFEMTYHLMLVELLAACTAGHCHATEVQARSLLPLDACALLFENADGVLLSVRAPLLEFVREVYLDVAVEVGTGDSLAAHDDLWRIIGAVADDMALCVLASDVLSFTDAEAYAYGAAVPFLWSYFSTHYANGWEPSALQRSTASALMQSLGALVGTAPSPWARSAARACVGCMRARGVRLEDAPEGGDDEPVRSIPDVFLLRTFPQGSTLRARAYDELKCAASEQDSRGEFSVLAQWTDTALERRTRVEAALVVAAGPKPVLSYRWLRDFMMRMSSRLYLRQLIYVLNAHVAATTTGFARGKLVLRRGLCLLRDMLVHADAVRDLAFLDDAIALGAAEIPLRHLGLMTVESNNVAECELLGPALSLGVALGESMRLWLTQQATYRFVSQDAELCIGKAVFRAVRTIVDSAIGENSDLHAHSRAVAGVLLRKADARDAVLGAGESEAVEWSSPTAGTISGRASKDAGEGSAAASAAAEGDLRAAAAADPTRTPDDAADAEDALDGEEPAVPTEKASLLSNGASADSRPRALRRILSREEIELAPLSAPPGESGRPRSGRSSVSLHETIAAAYRTSRNRDAGVDHEDIDNDRQSHQNPFAAQTRLARQRAATLSAARALARSTVAAEVATAALQAVEQSEFEGLLQQEEAAWGDSASDSDGADGDGAKGRRSDNESDASDYDSASDSDDAETLASVRATAEAAAAMVSRTTMGEAHTDSFADVATTAASARAAARRRARRRATHSRSRSATVSADGTMEGLVEVVDALCRPEGTEDTPDASASRGKQRRGAAGRRGAPARGGGGAAGALAGGEVTTAQLFREGVIDLFGGDDPELERLSVRIPSGCAAAAAWGARRLREGADIAKVCAAVARVQAVITAARRPPTRPADPLEECRAKKLAGPTRRRAPARLLFRYMRVLCSPTCASDSQALSDLLHANAASYSVPLAAQRYLRSLMWASEAARQERAWSLSCGTAEVGAEVLQALLHFVGRSRANRAALMRDGLPALLADILTHEVLNATPLVTLRFQARASRVLTALLEHMSDRNLCLACVFEDVSLCMVLGCLARAVWLHQKDFREREARRRRRAAVSTCGGGPRAGSGSSLPVSGAMDGDFKICPRTGSQEMSVYMEEAFAFYIAAEVMAGIRPALRSSLGESRAMEFVQRNFSSKIGSVEIDMYGAMYRVYFRKPEHVLQQWSALRKSRQALRLRAGAAESDASRLGTFAEGSLLLLDESAFKGSLIQHPVPRKLLACQHWLKKLVVALVIALNIGVTLTYERKDDASGDRSIHASGNGTLIAVGGAMLAVAVLLNEIAEHLESGFAGLRRAMIEQENAADSTAAAAQAIKKIEGALGSDAAAAETAAEAAALRGESAASRSAAAAAAAKGADSSVDVSGRGLHASALDRGIVAVVLSSAWRGLRGVVSNVARMCTSRGALSAASGAASAGATLGSGEENAMAARVAMRRGRARLGASGGKAVAVKPVAAADVVQATMPAFRDDIAASRDAGGGAVDGARASELDFSVFEFNAELQRVREEVLSKHMRDAKKHSRLMALMAAHREMLSLARERGPMAVWSYALRLAGSHWGTLRALAAPLLVFVLAVSGSASESLRPLLFGLLLLEAGRRNRILRYIVLSLQKSGMALLQTTLLCGIIIYLFAVVSFLFMSPEFTSEVGVYHCENLLTCFALFINFGLRDDTGISSVMVPPSRIMPDVVYEDLYFLIVSVLFIAIVSGVIIDTFSELRQSRERIADDLRNRCFVCGIRREEFDRSVEGGFDRHVREEHNMWNYVFFLASLQEKAMTDYSVMEAYVSQHLWRGNIRFYPIQRALSLMDEEGEKPRNG